jgi:hypothetical protein
MDHPRLSGDDEAVVHDSRVLEDEEDVDYDVGVLRERQHQNRDPEGMYTIRDEHPLRQTHDY